MFLFLYEINVGANVSLDYNEILRGHDIANIALILIKSHFVKMRIYNFLV